MIAKIASRKNHWYVKTDKALKGTGIRCMKEIGSFWDYKLTERAFDKLQAQYSVQIDNHEF